MIWSLALGFVKELIGPVFNFLNRRVEKEERVHISDNETLSQVGTSVVGGLSKADELNARLNAPGGRDNWSPWVWATILGFMLPFAFHTWQVCLDSSYWHLSLNGPWYWPVQWETHAVGSWKVAKLPGMFEVTEHAVIQSLFVGAATAATGVALIAALFRRGRK